MNRTNDPGAGGHVGPLLDAYRTGELDASARAAVAAHLAGCERCREELAALGPWAAAIERGYAALREESRELEPDWAAQRAAVVARTSGRPSPAPKRWGFRSWAPQVALVALAALIVGVVWRERGREPAVEPVATTSAPAPAEGGGGEASRFEQPEQLRDEDAVQAPPAAPAERKAAPGVVAQATPEEAAVRERREADEPAIAEGVPLGAVAPSETQLPADQRFERDARAALAARDTAAARRALALWSDSLALAAEDSARQAGLADSLRELVEPPE